MPADLRTTGRIVAAIAFTAVAAIIVIAVRNQRAVAPPPFDPNAAGPAAPPPPTLNSTVSGSGSGIVAGSEKGSWTRADPRTGVIESRLEYARLKPLPGGRYEITSPETWMFARGRARAHVSAPTGAILWPSRDGPPEAGDLTGGVIVRVFDGSRPAGVTPPLSEALYTLTVDSVHFEGALSQLESPDVLRIEGPGVTAEGVGLTLRISPDSRQLEYFRTLGRFVRIVPEALSKGAQAVSQQDTAANPPAQQTSSGTQAPPATDAYEALMSGPLKITQGSKSLEAGLLQLWAKTTDGKLPPGAFADFKPTNAPSSTKQVAAGPGNDRKASDPAAPIQIDWSGPLELRLLAATPPELGTDLIRARLSTPKGASPVKLAASDPAAELSASRVEYGATTRTVVIEGSLGSPAVLTAHEAGDLAGHSSLRFAKLDADLTTGVGAISGPGRFERATTSTDTASQRPPTAASWTERCDFTLDTSGGPAGSEGTVVPVQITLAGGVVATSADGDTSAEFISARFARSGTDTQGRPTSLPTRIELKGGATARAGEGTVQADTLTLAFAAKPDDRGRPIPIAASGRGRAIASQKGESISAESIDASLAQDPATGKARVTTFLAERGVKYTGPDGVTANSDRLQADVTSRRVELFGTPASVGRTAEAHAPRAAQSIRGERITLDGLAKTVTVPVAGSAESAANAAGLPPEMFTVTWDRQMTYDDTSGIARLEGGIDARGRRVGTDRYSAQADRAEIAVSPAGSAERTLQRVTLFRRDGSESDLVKVEAKRFIAGQPDALIDSNKAPLEGLIYFKGPEVTVAPATRSMSIPGPGLFLLEDRRSLADESSSAAETRGTSVVEWKGQLRTLDPSGTIVLDGGVTMRHRAIGAAEATKIESQALALDLLWPAPDASDQQPSVSKVTADGGVFVVHKQFEFVGTAASYDTSTGEVLVVGQSDRPVTIKDSTTGTTSTAEAAALDPRAGTWRVTGAGTITMPR